MRAVMIVAVQPNVAVSGSEEEKPMERAIRRLVILTGTVCLLATSAQADLLHVDNRVGSDAYDGRAAKPTSGTTGPTRSLRKALNLAATGDTIVIANTGKPYYESVTLRGRRHSGIADSPLTIIGNGAVFDGSRPVPVQAWKIVGRDLWMMTPWRKGAFQLIFNDKPVAEFRPPTRPDSLPAIPVGQWMAWRGRMYYQAAPLEDPLEKPFRYAVESMGISLYEVHDVVIQNLTLRHFRFDGINAHDRCRIVTVDSVKSLNNGRAGIAVGGSAAVLLRKCEIAGNRDHSVLITELGAVKADASKLSKPPTLERD